ncbi:MAG: hypothetical protein HY961_00930 [Ignavibacteriae bacterium]|nr:hypothetical protein [Ignavibacteriota bacterium]
MNLNTEQEILHEALEVFHQATGVMVAMEPRRINLEVDAEVMMRKGKEEWHFKAEIKPWLTKENAGPIVRRIGDNRRGWLLVTRHITPALATQLRELGLAFIDTAGNAFIDEPGLYIYVTGNRPRVKNVGEGVKRLFRPAGLRVLFALLCNPRLERQTYREIAAIADTALGTINWTMRDLMTMGFMINMGPKGRRLINKEKIVEQWVVAYPQQLKPKQFIGTYKADRYNWWRDTDLTPFDAQWGGEPAAAKLTQYLKPEKVTIYAGERIQELILQNKLRKDPRGDVEIVRRFWTLNPHEARKETVHPLLVYADLIATANDRNIETARMIYDKELAGLIRED